MKRSNLAACIVFATASAFASAADLTLTRVSLTTGEHVIRAEVAATPELRQRGLMGRAFLAPDGGMLFVFETPGIYCFWMKDTLLPLAVTFLDNQGRVLQVEPMQPATLTLHCPTTPIRYALEVTPEGLRHNGLAIGAVIRTLP